MSLHFPWLPLEVYSRTLDGAEDIPLAIVCRQKNQERIFQANALAQQQGVQLQQKLSAAVTICPNLRYVHQQLDQEQAALERLAYWACQYSSQVAIRSPYSLLIEVAGSFKLFGGQQELLRNMRSELDGLGHVAQMALAPVAAAAWVLARSHQGFICVADRGQLSARLQEIPLSCFDVNAQTLERLRAMGVHCLRELLALPREGLVRRYGQDLYDQVLKVLGQLPDVVDSIRLPERFVSSVQLLEPITHSEAILFVARRLLQELEYYLRARSMGTQCLQWCLQDEHGQQSFFELRASSPQRHCRYWLDLLSHHLEQLQLQHSVDVVQLKVLHCQAFAEQSQHLFSERAQSYHMDDLLDRLQARLGEEAVRTVCVRADHRPEHAWAYCQPGENTGLRTQALQRPLWLLAQPQALRYHQQQLFLRGPLQLMRGPERIESGWWQKGPVYRDYYVASNPRFECFWVFHDQRSQNWFLHGVFA